MITIQRDNVQLRIEEKDLRKYEEKGFKKSEVKVEEIVKTTKKEEKKIANEDSKIEIEKNKK